MKVKLLIVPAVVIVVLLISCDQYPKKVQQVLDLAGNHKPELERVIEYYKNQKNTEKLNAAYFLIGNMKDNFALEGEYIDQYAVIFDKLDSLHANKIDLPSTSPIVKQIWDSIVKVHGNPSVSKATVVTDYEHIKAEYLINNIEWAFEIRNRSPWLKKISFENFCEFILPYRIGNEKLEDWWELIDSKYKVFSDTVKNKTLYQAAYDFNQIMYVWLGLDASMRAYPFDMCVSEMHKARRGACKHLVYYEAVAMRAVGMPVAVDYSPIWGDLNRGHHWNVLLLEDGKLHPFDAADAKFGGITKYPYRFSKVYRQTYACHDDKIPNTAEIPPHLLNCYRIDVTNEYTKTFDISIPLTYQPGISKKFVTICTYTGKDWEAQDWGVLQDNSAQFKNMGSNLVYLVMYYNKGVYTPATDPFILDKNGNINYLRPSSRHQSMSLLRKYPSIPSNDTNMASMKGGNFQLASKKDFSDAINIATINKASINIEELNITEPGKYRYVRYLNPYKRFVNVAEIEFYGKDDETDSVKKFNGNPIGYPEISPEIGYTYQNAFDNNLETFFSSKLTKPMPDTCWAGLDLIKPKRVIRIRYLPRSDTNFMLDGDTYELCYWDTDKWVSLGKKIASAQTVIYDNVPANALYILHNLSRGKEERIFTYKDGKQIWW